MSLYRSYILPMQCGIVNIGDEILAGKILNTNAFDIASRLTALGHEVAYALSWPDDIALLASGLNLLLLGEDSTCLVPSAALANLWPKVDLLVVTGGLGPTHDDLTRDAVAAYLGVPMVQNPEATLWLAERLGKTVAELPESQLRQVILPVGVEPLRNPQGTACGLRFSVGKTTVYVFPGVPYELEAMMRLHVEPVLLADHVLLRRLIWTFGLSESKQREYLNHWVPAAPFRFSSLPNERGVVLSLQASVPKTEAALLEVTLKQSCGELLARLPQETVVHSEGLDLPQAVFAALSEAGETLSVAESCTGGGLGFLITEVPGSSLVFRQGFLTYSNAAKVELLGVDPALLAEYGAVSEQVAQAMARGCVLRSGTTWAVAITGIAGPDGGSLDKPVGCVFIAVAHREGGMAFRKLQFKGTRNRIRWQSAYVALNLLRLVQKGHVILNT
jgi:nicotinamide-nucleotide amidase